MVLIGSHEDGITKELVDLALSESQQSLIDLFEKEVQIINESSYKASCWPLQRDLTTNKNDRQDGARGGERRNLLDAASVDAALL